MFQQNLDNHLEVYIKSIEEGELELIMMEDGPGPPGFQRYEPPTVDGIAVNKEESPSHIVTFESEALEELD